MALAVVGVALEAGGAMPLEASLGSAATHLQVEVEVAEGYGTLIAYGMQEAGVGVLLLVKTSPPEVAERAEAAQARLVETRAPAQPALVVAAEALVRMAEVAMGAQVSSSSVTPRARSALPAVLNHN